MATSPIGQSHRSPFITGSLAADGQSVTTDDGRGIHLEHGRGSVSLSGTFSTTIVSLQKRRDDEDLTTGWKTVYQYDPTTDDPREFAINDRAKSFYRLFIESGKYSDGPVVGRIDAAGGII
jgi:hypothetical protein